MFDTVYAEEAAFEYEATGRILGRLRRFAPEGKITVVPVRSAEDVTARRGQRYGLQRDNPKLVLAVNRGPFIHEGSRNCQNFGADAFYYCSVAVNCIGRCSYCYLSGASRSANLIAYVNVGDCCGELARLIADNRGRSLLVPVSYDNDIYALEGLFGYVAGFADLAADCRQKGFGDFALEVRTKCGTRGFLDNINPGAAENMIFTWSVSPQRNIRLFEPATSPLANRLRAAEYALGKGFRVRLSFDPVLATVPTWREDYRGLIEELRRRGIIQALDGAGVGGFRVPADYLKTMRRHDPAAAPLFDNFVQSGGTLGYSGAREKAITDFVKGCLADAGLDERKIFTTVGG